MKKDRAQDLFLEQIRKIPIIQVACEKAGIARSSVYRWRDEDPKFHKELEEALAEGEALINEMSESQLISLIKDKSWQAISFWLRHRSPKFRERLEVSANFQTEEKLTPEQENVVKKALELATIIPEQEPTETNNQNNKNQHE